jgi:hypothetical protein
MATHRSPAEPPERSDVSSVAGYGSRLPWGIVVVLSFILVAIVKPWDLGRTPPPAPTMPAALAASTAPSAPVVTPAPTLEPGAIPCLNYEAWRVVTIERTLDQEVHRWIVVDPTAAAADALDPTIPAVRVVAGRLDGIGFCAPETLVTAATPHIYRITDGTATRVDEAAALRLVRPAGTRAARIFQPPTGTEPWSPGRYVVEVLVSPAGGDGQGTSSAAWFAIDVEQAPSDPVAPAPSEAG